jgi:2-polyprenyl-3-methyl-5-hydroxy-6-metoxy-1,4-benzoquinol methylase
MAAPASTPVCPLCKSLHTYPMPRYGSISPLIQSIRRCSGCGTAFAEPMPDSDTLAKHYDADYYGRGAGKFINPVERIVHLSRSLRAKAIRRYVDRGRVLDVGCGRGLMLKHLKDRGHEVDGVELDTVAAKRAGNALGQSVFNSLDEVVRRRTEQYAAVCFWHSLEHMPEPGKALDTADHLLAPGGLLVISAPHIESLQGRLSGTSWLHLDLPRHLVHFDMMRLAAFMQKKGYRLLQKTHLSQEYQVIDTLCWLYSFLGFEPFYPFNLIRDITGHEARGGGGTIRAVVGLALLLPLTVEALFVSNFFSMLGAGSTVTLFFRKPC